MKQGCCRMVSALFAVLVLGSCAMPDAAGTWTVASWNVQNLFDGIDNGTEYSEFDPEDGEWTDELYRIRLEKTAEILLSLCSGGPDLIILQEVENQNVLEDLAAGPLSAKGVSLAILCARRNGCPLRCAEPLSGVRRSCQRMRFLGRTSAAYACFVSGLPSRIVGSGSQCSLEVAQERQGRY